MCKLFAFLIHCTLFTILLFVLYFYSPFLVARHVLKEGLDILVVANAGIILFEILNGLVMGQHIALPADKCLHVLACAHDDLG